MPIRQLILAVPVSTENPWLGFVGTLRLHSMKQALDRGSRNFRSCGSILCRQYESAGVVNESALSPIEIASEAFGGSPRRKRLGSRESERLGFLEP
jgi:hypothetical protein